MSHNRQHGHGHGHGGLKFLALYLFARSPFAPLLMLIIAAWLLK